jgi:L-threonylcarbamoyladenylate synthase
MDVDLKQAQNLLIQGKIGVLPADTIYAIHGLALNRQIVEKIYELRERNPQKPFIILISDLSDLEKFKVKLTPKIKNFLENIWPAKVSVVLPCPQKEFEYLHRGTNTLAFRLPNKDDLRELLSKTGPLISTSVNPQGLVPATNIQEAKDYFGDNLDFYVDVGTIKSQASTVVKVTDKIEILRQGDVHIDTKTNF